MRLSVFASGSGTNFQAILDSISSGLLDAEPALFLSDNPDAYAIERAHRANVPTVVIKRKDFPDKDSYVKAMLSALDESNSDFIALAGYMKLVPAEVVDSFRNRITNIHPALIPSFCGKGFYGMRVHRAVIEQGCKVSGVTVHLVDERYDTGPIIAQRCVPVYSDDTPDKLAERIHPVEHRLYPRVLQLFSVGAIRVDGRIVRIDKKWRGFVEDF